MLSIARQSSFLPTSIVTPKNRVLAIAVPRRFNTSPKCKSHRPRLVFSSIADEFDTKPEDVCDKQWWEQVPIQQIMTPNPISVSPDTSVLKALEILTEHHISGIPVMESDGKVVGVVSAYDILALDSTPGQLDKPEGFFPPIGKCDAEFGGDRNAMWQNFFSLRNGVLKAQASKVVDSMHDTYCVKATDPLSVAANLIVRKNTQRVFVLNDNNELCGVVSRGDILKVTLDKYKCPDK